MSGRRSLVDVAIGVGTFAVASLALLADLPGAFALPLGALLAVAYLAVVSRVLSVGSGPLLATGAFLLCGVVVIAWDAAHFGADWSAGMAQEMLLVGVFVFLGGATLGQVFWQRRARRQRAPRE